MARILMIAAEASPFAQTGGLGDVIGALPAALARAGQEVAVILPLYRDAAVSKAHTVYGNLRFGLGAHAYSANILEETRNGVRHFFVHIPELYDRDGFYSRNGSDYPDNYLRFAALCRAALGVTHRVFAADVVHCHDWQAALLPLFVKDTYRLHPAYEGIKTVFTIHNLGYQGICPPGALSDLGLPNRLFRPDLLEYYGEVNILKAGLLFADALTTVSPRYAKEIQTAEFGFGLDGLLRSRRDVLTGILNGADYDCWDPATDPHIPEHFDRLSLDGKRACKESLLAEMGLPANRIQKPLIGIVSRLAEQKGFDLLMQLPDEFATLDLSLVVLGSGEQRLENFFRDLASAYPEKVAVRIGYENALAHRIEAGSDMFLMPSRYEPCGLNQIYSMRYATLPIVHATGGLDDTVDAGTGFLFGEESAAALLAAVRAALAVYDQPQWKQMMEAAMERNFSWDVSAAQYIRVYERVLAR